MRILQLCNKPPYPPIDGGTRAMLTLTRGLLHAGHEVKVLCICTPKHPLVPEDVPADLMAATRMEGIFVDTSLNIVDAFTDLVTADNYNISRFFSPDMDIRLIRLMTEATFDIVHLESLFMTPYINTIRRYSKARIVLRSHNLEHVIQERLALGERNFIKRPYRQYLAKQLKQCEMEVLQKVDGVAAISPSDAEHFKAYGTGTPITTIPFGVDPAHYPQSPVRDRPVDFFHLGSMDWQPNEAGIRWMLKEVWPGLVRQLPQATLHLAGNKMPEDLIGIDIPGVHVQGRVEDPIAFMQAHAVMVVPLFSAGGMRVKIIEGMAMGRAILSTTIGAEGINCTNGTDIMLADDAASFVEQMVRLYNDPALVQRLGQAAHMLVQNHFTEDTIARELIAFYKDLLK